ncbi:8448_t:CDS:2 [Acaulospora morrowiae]|uniref:8448_t:CDS:1 n=1 Tax=Acaulospora morrowiae TaxID=94023 RepID=A0A9N9CLV0_9GLOM|nr:8448_t:CDS:2 [Acaulospora morrowiae]
MNKEFIPSKFAFDIVGTYLPIIQSISIVANEINFIYVNAECNKEICGIMTNRVKSAEFALQMTIRNIVDEESFRQKSYQAALFHFENILINVKEFTKKVSKFKSFRKFSNAGEVKKNFEKLTLEYDACVKDLHFAIDIVSMFDKEEEYRKVDKALKDINETLKIFYAETHDFKCDAHYTNHKVQDVDNKLDILQRRIELLYKTQSDDELKKIDSSELTDPPYSSRNNIRAIKKIYKTMEVDCKDINQSNNTKSILVILQKLTPVLPYILHFYGLSKVDTRDVMVFEWAEYGSLKDLYDSYDIPWGRKIQIIRDICRGLVWLRSFDLYHHDLRCENVLVLRNLDPKLGNFKHAHMKEEEIKKISDAATTTFNWMAPELIQKYKEGKYKENIYRFNCEMFSFGMLIWELCYEKLPYKNWNPVKISNHVLGGNRERLVRGKFENTKDLKIQENFITIIENMWKQVPEQRIEVTKLHLILEELALSYQIRVEEPMLLKDGNYNFEGEEEDATSINLVINFEKGIELHKEKNYKEAWKCFEENADLGNISAKYWKGYYLSNGYDGVVKKDKEKAMELLKEAADNGDPYGYKLDDAQFRYVGLLIESLKNNADDEDTKQDKRKKILHYLKLAADNNNVTAMQLLGDIYINGKLEVQKNEELGSLYLKLAKINMN